MPSSISYTSFPPVDVDEPGSPDRIPLEQLRMADNSFPSVDDLLEMSDSGVEEEETTITTTATTAEFRSLDCAGFRHLVAPVTPTKERNRRATMPEPAKPRPQDVSLPCPLLSSSSMPSFLVASSVILELQSHLCPSQILIVVNWPHLSSSDPQNRSQNSNSHHRPPSPHPP